MSIKHHFYCCQSAAGTCFACWAALYQVPGFTFYLYCRPNTAVSIWRMNASCCRMSVADSGPQHTRVCCAVDKNSDRSFAVAGLRILNTLPASLRSTDDDCVCFKRLLKARLFDWGLVTFCFHALCINSLTYLLAKLLLITRLAKDTRLTYHDLVHSVI